MGQQTVNCETVNTEGRPKIPSRKGQITKKNTKKGPTYSYVVLVLGSPSFLHLETPRGGTQEPSTEVQHCPKANSIRITDANLSLPYGE